MEEGGGEGEVEGGGEGGERVILMPNILEHRVVQREGVGEGGEEGEGEEEEGGGGVVGGREQEEDTHIQGRARLMIRVISVYVCVPTVQYYINNK